MSGFSNNTSAVLGEEAWLLRRKEWTTETMAPPDATEPQQHQQIRTTNVEQKLNIYQALIIDRRPFKKPIPLGVVIDVVVHGWKKNGTWPEDEEVPPLGKA